MKKLLILLLAIVAGKFLYAEYQKRPDSTYSSAEWFVGTRKLKTADSEAMKNEAPLLVYVYTEWCKFCQKFEKELLYTEGFQRDLLDIVKLKINPDHDGEAKAFMEANRVTGYPTVLVKYHKATQFKKVSPYKRSAGKVQLKSKSEFLQEINTPG